MSARSARRAGWTTAAASHAATVIVAVKHRLVGTRIGAFARHCVWWAGAPRRHRHPELWDMHLDGERTRRVLDRLVQTDWNCVDVGAHVGAILHRLVGLAPDGAHHAVEPSPDLAHRLRRRFPQVVVVEAAAFDHDGVAIFHEATTSGFSGLAPPVEGAVARRRAVQLVRLDTSIGTNTRIDLIKLDVEGAELPALRGATEILARHRPAVLFECGPHATTASYGYERTDLYDFLIGAGYDVYTMADALYDRTPIGRDEFDRTGRYPFRGFNFLALPAGRSLPARPPHVRR